MQPRSLGEDYQQTDINQKISNFTMSKILVGRDNPKEVNIGVTVSSVAKVETGNAETEKELAEDALEDEQVVAVEEGGVPEAEEAAPKRRGKKRGKA